MAKLPDHLRPENRADPLRLLTQQEMKEIAQREAERCIASERERQQIKLRQAQAKARTGKRTV
ncbi:MAG: hypothetical protein ACWGQW_23295, partial [bacterium]